MTMIRTITTLEPNRIAAGDLTWPSGGDKPWTIHRRNESYADNADREHVRHHPNRAAEAEPDLGGSVGVRGEWVHGMVRMMCWCIPWPRVTKTMHE
jgi:hypothetical protein